MEERTKKLHLEREVFVDALKKVLKDIDRHFAGTYGQMASNPLKNLHEHGRLTVTFILQEMPRLREKTSTLPSGQREVLNEIINKAVWTAATDPRNKQTKKEDEDTEPKHGNGKLALPRH